MNIEINYTFEHTMNETRNNCAICNNILHNIFSLEKVPTKAICGDFNAASQRELQAEPVEELKSRLVSKDSEAVLGTNVEDTSNIYHGKLSFSKCVTCNTIQLDEMIPLHILYSDSHNITSVGNVWKNYFKLFLEKLQPLIQNRRVFEIGCPSGKIALNVSGFDKYFIVDPNKNDSINFTEKNITFIQSFFDKDFVCDAKVDVVVHSHLFEHIYEPNVFLQKCYEVLHDDGEMFFGVPNMSHFIESKTWPFLGVCFEHTIFLNEENITFLLKKNGFDVVEIIYYEKHSVMYHCKKQKNAQIVPGSLFQITDYINGFNESISSYNQFVKCSNDVLKDTTKNAYIFGAGYNSQILISMGVDETNLTGVLDNCIEKQGKYLYGFQLMVFSPQVLADEDCIVILKNGYYCEEIKQQIIDINPNTVIIY